MRALPGARGSPRSCALTRVRAHHVGLEVLVGEVPHGPGQEGLEDLLVRRAADPGRELRVRRRRREEVGMEQRRRPLPQLDPARVGGRVALRVALDLRRGARDVLPHDEMAPVRERMEPGRLELEHLEPVPGEIEVARSRAPGADGRCTSRRRGDSRGTAPRSRRRRRPSAAAPAPAPSTRRGPGTSRPPARCARRRSRSRRTVPSWHLLRVSEHPRRGLVAVSTAPRLDALHAG